MLSASESQLWEAMDIGPQWILRETEDVTLPEADLRRAVPELGAPSVRPSQAARPLSPSSSVSSFPPPPQFPDVFQTPPARPASQAARPARPIPQSQVPAPATKPAAIISQTPETLAACAKADWQTLEGLAKDCRCCSMAKSRQHVVFSEGGPGVRIALVGEAPGSEEDLQGIPFVGKSGQLLTQMLESVGIERNRDIAIMNVLKCRPPGNRNPAPAEVACCAAFLMRQLELVRPDVVLIMGRFAAQTLLRLEGDAKLGALRGRVYEVAAGSHSMKAVVSYHPSYLLRAPDEKAKAWQDLVLLKRTIREAGISLAPVTRKKLV